ncbi:hypothetical protein H4F41_25020, partial [Escherichia coli]|nr:hypothetical protein [Escherichia coli]
MALELSNCCFCVELRTGSLIIGYLSLVGNIILTIASIMGIAGSAYIMQNGKDQDTQDAGLIALIVVIIAFIFILINLIMNIVLLVGLHKYKRGHVKAYLIY